MEMLVDLTMGVPNLEIVITEISETYINFKNNNIRKMVMYALNEAD